MYLQFQVISNGCFPMDIASIRGHHWPHVPVDLAKIRCTPNFCLGDKQDATHVQNYLKHYGYMPLLTAVSHAEVDEHTETALRVFQKFFKLEVDGVFGPQTKEALAACRCRVSDFLDPVDLQAFGSWKHRDLTFCFGKQSPQLSADIFKAAVIRAMTTWTNAGVGLSFTEVALDQNPDIFIEFRQANDPDHSMTTPLPLHFDDEEPKLVGGAFPDALDVETIGLHEIGHILGLKHSEVLGAVIYPFVYENVINRKLAADDLRGIRNLYAS